MKENKPFWELGLNPITMTKFESLDRIRHRDEIKEHLKDAESKLLQQL